MPLKEQYDLVWIQWVIGYLTDGKLSHTSVLRVLLLVMLIRTRIGDLIAFLKRCKEGLRKKGLIVVKDNLNSKEGFYVDKEDNSITR